MYRVLKKQRPSRQFFGLRYRKVPKLGWITNSDCSFNSSTLFISKNNNNIVGNVYRHITFKTCADACGQRRVP